MSQRVEVGPGTYPVRNVTTGVVTNVVVPTLTVAIAQTAPTVGQTLTLTTNAAPGAAYQWRRGGTPISGATSATYTTVSADAGQVLTCQVVSGVQDVTSAGVTVGGAAELSAGFVPGSYVSNQDAFLQPKTFTGVSIGAADSTRRLYIPIWMTREESRPCTLSVNGGAGLSPIAQIRPQGTRQCLLFAADVPTGTTANFTLANDGGSFDMGVVGLAVIRVVGAHTAATATDAPIGPTAPISIATNAGDTVFVQIMGRLQTTAPAFTPPAGFTEHLDGVLAPAVPSHVYFLASGTAAGGSPETFTTTPTIPNDEHSIIALRLRAA